MAVARLEEIGTYENPHQDIHDENLLSGSRRGKDKVWKGKEQGQNKERARGTVAASR